MRWSPLETTSTWPPSCERCGRRREPEFAAELDGRAAAGFPRTERRSASPAERSSCAFAALSPQRLLRAAGAFALAAIASRDRHRRRSSDTEPIQPLVLPIAPSNHRHKAARATPKLESQYSRAFPPVAGGPTESSLGSAGRQSPSQLTESSTSVAQPRLDASSSVRATPRHRDVERSAEIDLLAPIPPTSRDDCGQGLQRRSRRATASFCARLPRDGARRRRGALRPADPQRASSAMRSPPSRRSTRCAPATSRPPTSPRPRSPSSEQLQDSRAKLDGLLAQLSSAESEAESEAIEVELRARAAPRRAPCAPGSSALHRRVNFSRVSLRIETGELSDSGTTAEAGESATRCGDAGHILGIAAGVTVVGLAVLAPLALIVLLAWLAHRLWLRTRREQALDA